MKIRGTFRRAKVVLAMGLVAVPASMAAAEVPPIALVRKLGGLSNPVHVTHAGDGSGRLFVVEQPGRIRIVKGGALLPAPFLDISTRVSCCGERGLLSVAFPPRFGGSPQFYVNYTDLNGDTTISRFFISSFATPDAADPSSEQVLLKIAQPFANHNGGQLAFGPDGYLYIGMGDGGSGGDPQNNAQNPASLLGKLLRIDVESGVSPYGVPASNPFVGDAAYHPEIWALGLRNPWRFSFDRATGDLLIGDVGQGEREEVDFQPAGSRGGENYGWRLMEGTACFNPSTCSTAGLVLPVVDYLHAGGDCSVTGGFVYRGHSYSRLAGIYFFADYCTGRLRALTRTDSGWDVSVLQTAGFNVSTFGEDEAGELYLVDYGQGVLYQVVDAAGPSTVLTVPVVLDVAGAGGVRFTSELTLANRGTTPVTFDLTYTPAASLHATGAGTVPETLAAGRQTTIPDVIAYLRQKGLAIPAAGDQGGTLRILSSGASSSDAVFASARTTAPAGGGRAGLAYAAIRPDEALKGPVSLFGLREDAAFRSNLALVNAANPAKTSSVLLKVTLTSGDPGDSRTTALPPMRLAAGQWLQLNHVLSQAGMTNGWATVERVEGTDPFYAYAVVNDNVTNDGSIVPPVPLRELSDALMLPLAAHTAGFSTECVVANPGPGPLYLLIGPSGRATLQPGEQRFIPDLFSFIGFQAGDVPVSLPMFGVASPPGGPGSPKSRVFFAGARTFRTAPGGGSYGLFYPAVPFEGAATDEAWIYGLRQDSQSRSNIAFVNVSPDYGGPAGPPPPPYTLGVDLFDGETGLLAGSVTISLDSQHPDWVQINSLLARFGIRNGYARVRPIGTPARFLVYGVVNDGAVPGEGTSDGSYIPMVIPLPPPPFPQ